MEEQQKQQILERYSKLGIIGKRSILEKIPLEERRYKCHTCYTIVDKTPCPVCGETHLEILCLLDHCHCHHDVMTTHGYCPLCGEPVCPECNCHDILAISRVTGLGDQSRAVFY